MTRFTLNLTFVFVFFCSCFVAQGQIVFYGLTDNPALFNSMNTAGQRNLISESRVVIIPADSQQVCINRPDIGTFDTLTLESSLPGDLQVKIIDNCITIYASADAATGTYDLDFLYTAFSGATLNYTVKVEVTQPIGLPFFDDFAYADKYPDPARWVDKDVFINNTMAEMPPSIGVATFDGLNSNGTPYGGSFGRADFLTSAYIDLSTVPSSDPVYLSFYLQPKGKTFNHQQRDSIVVEFKNANGQWETAASYKGIDPSNPSTYVPPFSYYSIQVDPRFYYSGFQFRFVNYNYRLGVYSTWHLDYVKLIANQVPTKNQMDIAFTDPPNGMLKTYSAIPYKQLSGFESAELSDQTKIRLFNHFLEVPEDLSNPRLTIDELTTGTPVLDKELVNSVPQLNPPAGFNAFDNPFDPSDIAVKLPSIPSGKLPLVFRTQYHFDQDQEVAYLEANNTAMTKTEVGYVLAYDDGSAELNIAAEANNSVKSQIAVKYHLNVGDTLKAVQIHFPRLYDDVSHQLFNLKVWIGSLKEEPDYYYQLQRPIYTDAIYDTLQGFTTYPLVNDLTKEPTPLYIPPGDFYIGWQQFSVSTTGQYIPVGFDRNYEGGEALTYYKSTGDWKPLSELSTSPLLKGIPMIRAKFQDAWLTSKTHANPTKELTVYPNPVQSTLFIKDNEETAGLLTYQIFDYAGKLVSSGKYKDNISVAGLLPGVYVLVVKGINASKVSRTKFVKF